MALLGLEPNDLAPACSGPELSPASVRHQLVSHPLLTLDALAELADRLPPDGVEHHLNDLPTVLVDGETPRLEGESPGELVRGVFTNRCWVVLWNIERDPAYAELLDGCLGEVTPLVTPHEPMVVREGFVFISAPNTVTPVHIDPEHNMLLQVAGDKTLYVGRFPDSASRHEQIERISQGNHRWLPFAATGEREFHMSPGVGVYVPPFAPHRVINGDGPCISLSVTWHTSSFFRDEQVYYVNARLRRLGFKPRPPGESAVRDALKASTLRLGGQALRAARGTAARVRARSDRT